MDRKSLYRGVLASVSEKDRDYSQIYLRLEENGEEVDENLLMDVVDDLKTIGVISERTSHKEMEGLVLDPVHSTFFVTDDGKVWYANTGGLDELLESLEPNQGILERNSLEDVKSRVTYQYTFTHPIVGILHAFAGGSPTYDSIEGKVIR